MGTGIIPPVATNLYDALHDDPPSIDTPGRILAIGAHPDDIEFGCGATIARWTSRGADAVFAIVTDGSKGTWDPDADPATVASTRSKEAESAGAVLGASVVEHLGYVDGDLEYSMDLRARTAALIRRHRPDVVLSHDPWQRYQLHPDHRVTGFAVVDGVVAARDPHYFPEQEMLPHRPDALLLWSADEPDYIEPTTPAALEAKVAALLCHASQAETTMAGADRDEASREAFSHKIEAWARRAGHASGVESAEVFKRITP